MTTNPKSYIRLLFLYIRITTCFFLFSLSSKAQNKLLFDSDAIKKFSGHPKDSIKYLNIYLLYSFNDSIVISLGQTDIFRKFCKTNEISALAGATTAMMPKDGETLSIYCFNQRLKQTIKFKNGYKYLYVWKDGDKFQFEFTNKVKMLE